MIVEKDFLYTQPYTESTQTNSHTINTLWANNSKEALSLRINLPFPVDYAHKEYKLPYTLMEHYIQKQLQQSETLSHTILDDGVISDVMFTGNDITLLSYSDMQKLFQLSYFFLNRRDAHFPISVKLFPSITNHEKIRLLKIFDIHRVTLEISNKSIGEESNFKQNEKLLEILRKYSFKKIHFNIPTTHSLTTAQQKHVISLLQDYTPEEVTFVNYYVAQYQTNHIFKETLNRLGYSYTGKNTFTLNSDNKTLEYIKKKNDGIIVLGAGLFSQTENIYYTYDKRVDSLSIYSKIKSFNSLKSNDFLTPRYFFKLHKSAV